jgi:hypothetical protein
MLRRIDVAECCGVLAMLTPKPRGALLRARGKLMERQTLALHRSRRGR